MGEVIEREERESLLWFNKKASLTSLLQTIKKTRGSRAAACGNERRNELQRCLFTIVEAKQLSKTYINIFTPKSPNGINSHKPKVKTRAVSFPVFLGLTHLENFLILIFRLSAVQN